MTDTFHASQSYCVNMIHLRCHNFSHTVWHQWSSMTIYGPFTSLIWITSSFNTWHVSYKGAYMHKSNLHNFHEMTPYISHIKLASPIWKIGLYCGMPDHPALVKWCQFVCNKVPASLARNKKNSGLLAQVLFRTTQFLQKDFFFGWIGWS